MAAFRGEGNRMTNTFGKRGNTIFRALYIRQTTYVAEESVCFVASREEARWLNNIPEFDLYYVAYLKGDRHELQRTGSARRSSAQDRQGESGF
jgi:hypothetical protein